ncbi:hypothetical protein O181_056985 [Austropuccinia psidii MF-1]|uniref:Uncharacterized protein n=1 Tax=Austropuccinia psidii MF-1 TaxID=1389203 RepID=A0A9Q3HWK7_9BASI|nr:hypothetical protein [Austropuccinia psidii MF-1]
MPSTRSGTSYNPSSSSKKGHRRDYGRSQSVTEGQSYSIDGKDEHIALNSRMEEKNSPPPKQVPKTAPVASRRNSNMKKAATSSEQGQRKGTSHKLRTRAKERHQPKDLTARDTGLQRFNRMPWKMYLRFPEQ